ncbi:MAG: Mu transposase domain-containing protein [Candidatus Dormibacteria bacterium]
MARETDTLLPLPRAAFEMVTWESRKVPPDVHVTGAGALYTVPHRHLGLVCELLVRLMIRIRQRNQLKNLLANFEPEVSNGA